MSSIEIDVAPNIEAYFEDAVHEAVVARGVEASETAERYLALLLSGYARGELTSSALDGPVTFLLRDALEAQGMDRFQRLRRIGDGVLYVVGFFGSAVTRRGADREYVIHVGSSAYEHASTMLRMGGSKGDAHDVLRELSRGYHRFVEVLAEIADGMLASAGNDATTLLRLYERWRRTRSARLARALGASGLCPAPGSGDAN